MSGIIGSKFNHRGSGLVGSLGTDGQHMLSSGAGKKHVFETVSVPAAYDDSAIKSDILTLAIKEAMTENRVAYNLTSAFIDQFEDETGVDTSSSTNEIYSSEAYSTISVSAGAYETGDRTGTYTITEDVEPHTYPFTDWIDGVNSGVPGAAWYWIASATDIAGDYITFDLGTGNSKLYTAAKFYMNTIVDCGVWKWQGSDDDITYTDLSANFNWSVPSAAWIETTFLGGATAYRYIRLLGISGTVDPNAWQQELEFKVGSVTANATGDVISNAQTAIASQTKVSGVILYKNNGTSPATLNTDIKCYFSCDNGSNWTQSIMTAAGTFSSGILMAKAPEVTCTGGTSIKYKIEFANQAAGTQETQIHAIGMNY